MIKKRQNVCKLQESLNLRIGRWKRNSLKKAVKGIGKYIMKFRKK